MVLNGRVICNVCRCEIGVVYVRVLRPVHFCPDCQAKPLEDRQCQKK